MAFYFSVPEGTEHCLKLERCQGLLCINKVKQYQTVLSFKVSLMTQLFQSHQSKQRFLFICLVMKINLSPKLQSTSLTDHMKTNIVKVNTVTE